MTLQSGLTYKLTKPSGKTLFVKLKEYDPIYKKWKVQVHGLKENTTYISEREYSFIPVRSCTVLCNNKNENCFRKRHKTISSNKQMQVFLYILQIGKNLYKIGCTENVERRMKQGKTWCNFMKLISKRRIPSEKSLNWKKYEQNLHKQVQTLNFHEQSKEGGSEIFYMSAKNLLLAQSILKNLKFDL